MDCRHCGKFITDSMYFFGIFVTTQTNLANARDPKLDTEDKASHLTYKHAVSTAIWSSVPMFLSC